MRRGIAFQLTLVIGLATIAVVPFTQAGHQVTPIYCDFGALIGETICPDTVPGPCEEQDPDQGRDNPLGTPGIEFPREEEPTDPRCPDDDEDPTGGGASATCIAMGYMSRVDTAALTPFIVDHVLSRSTARVGGGTGFDVATGSAALHEVDVQPGVLDAGTVTSDCEAIQFGRNAAYEVNAHAEVQDVVLDLTVLHPLLYFEADILEERLSVTAGPNSVSYSCTKTNFVIDGSGPITNFCGGPNMMTQVSAGAFVVTIIQDERTGPTPLPNGAIMYTGATFHIYVEELFAGTTLAEVYINYVAAVVPQF